MSEAAARQGKRWTAQDERLLRHYTVQGLTARQIGEKLGRTRNAVLIKRGAMINRKEKKTMYDDYDPGLCVGCEWCYYGSPRDCPQCKITREEENDVEDLERIRPYEPNVVKAAWAIFGDSYRYRQEYNAFKERMKRTADGQLTFDDIE